MIRNAISQNKTTHCCKINVLTIQKSKIFIQKTLAFKFNFLTISRMFLFFAKLTFWRQLLCTYDSFQYFSKLWVLPTFSPKPKLFEIMALSQYSSSTLKRVKFLDQEMVKTDSQKFKESSVSRIHLCPMHQHKLGMTSTFI